MPRKKIPHFRLYIDDFLRGTEAMTASEVGDYIRLLCVIYDQNNQVKNDAHVLRHLLGCIRPRDAKAKIGRLIELDKLSVDKDGFIHNGRADLEIASRLETVETAPQASDTPSTQAKKSMKSPRAHARPCSSNKDSSSLLESSFHASDLFNGTAPAALGALGLNGRAPSPPFFKAVRAPPSALVQMLVEQGLHKRH